MNKRLAIVLLLCVTALVLYGGYRLLANTLDIKYHEAYKEAEWRSLSQSVNLIKNDGPIADAGVFLSKSAIENYLKKYENIRLEYDAIPLLGKSTATLEDIRVSSRRGLMYGECRIRFDTAATYLSASARVYFRLIYKGFRTEVNDETSRTDGKKELKYKQILVAEPFYVGPDFGLVDSIALYATGKRASVWTALAQVIDTFFIKMPLEVPIELPADVDIPLSIDENERLPFTQKRGEDDVETGYIKIHKSLSAPNQKLLLSYSAPIFVDNGVWLLAWSDSSGGTGKVPIVDSAPPDRQNIEPEIKKLQDQLEAVVPAFGTPATDFEFWIRERVIEDLVKKISESPVSQRTLSVTSREPEGLIFDQIDKDSTFNTYRLEVRPKGLSGSAVLTSIKASSSSDGPLSITGHVKASISAQAVAKWESWVLLILGSYEIQASGNAETDLAGSLALYTHAQDGVQGVYWGFDFACTQFTVSAISETGKIFEILPFYHGQLKVEIPVALFEKKGKGTLILADLPQRSQIVKGLEGAKSERNASPRVVPPAFGIDIRLIPEAAGKEKSKYFIRGKVAVAYASSGKWSEEERKTNRDRLEKIKHVEFPGEQKCKPKKELTASINGLGVKPGDKPILDYLDHLKREYKSREEQLKAIEEFSKSGNLTEAAKKIVQSEIVKIKTDIEAIEKAAREELEKRKKKPLRPHDPGGGALYDKVEEKVNELFKR